MVGSVIDELRVFEARRPTPLRLRDYFEIGDKHSSDRETLLHSAQFLHTELPIRCARLIRCMSAFPQGLSDSGPCTQMRLGYVQSFQELHHLPHPRTVQDELNYFRVAERIRDRHCGNLETIGCALAALRVRTGNQPLEPGIHAALDRFHLARLSVSILLNQYVAMHHARRHWVGILCDHTSPAAICDEMGASAQALARVHYGNAPKVIVEGDVACTFLYIPSHVQHILFELLKNALRATLEAHGTKRQLPPVRVMIVAGREDVTLRISDEGGGIMRSNLEKVFEYLFSTAPIHDRPAQPEEDVDPIAGLGHGLSVSRIYARYFGGDLRLESLQGYGTDAYLYLPANEEAREVIP